jgi:hypothetical protein
MEDIIAKIITAHDEGDLETVSHLVNAHSLITANVWTNGAPWLNHLHGITASLARSSTYSNSYDYLHMIRWVVEFFEMNDYTSTEKHNAFVWACANQYLSIAKWMYKKFELTAFDLRNDNNSALSSVISASSDVDLSACPERAQRVSGQAPCPERSEWTPHNLSCDDEVVKNMVGDATYEIEFLDWLINIANLTVDDIRMVRMDIFEFTHTNILNYLTDRFDSEFYDYVTDYCRSRITKQNTPRMIKSAAKIT